MKTSTYILTIFIFLAIFPLYAQELTDTETTTEETPAESIPEQDISFDDNTVYIIADFIFDVKGRVRHDALIYNGEFQKGERIQGKANLEKYIRDKTQLLTNQRVLKDNVQISYSLGEQNPDGAYPVILTIKVEETWNIIALPKPNYDQNTGFKITINVRDYNFLGTMNPLRIDFGYEYDQNGRSSFLLEIDSDTPFNAFGYNWNINFDNSFGYRVVDDPDPPFYYQNLSGISMELPFRNTTFTFGFEESFNVNEENPDRYKKRYGGTEDDFQTGLYMSSKLYTTWKIPIGLEVSEYGELTYTPQITATFNHELPQWELHEFRHGPFLGFSHSFGFGKIDWLSNFRSGYSAWLSNGYSYDFHRLRNNVEPLSVSLSLTGTGHFIISDFFSISSRLRYRHWFYHDPEWYEQAGDTIRGILDKSMCADYMISLNMDFPFRVLEFTPSRWFEKWKTTFFDFELQLSPIIDMAFYNDPNPNPKTNISFNHKNFAVGGGLEVIVFPAFMRNFYVRLSLACNIRELITARPFGIPGGKNREITFGTGLFY